MPPVVQTIGLVLLGILPFGLFVWLQTADDSGDTGGEPASAEQSPLDASQTIPLAFPFGEPSAEIAPVADPEIVAMAAPPSPPSSSPSPRSPVPGSPTPSPVPPSPAAKPAPPPQCSDGKDNDGDGFIDMADRGCTSPSDNSESPDFGITACSNGRDDDGDGLIDMADPDCRTPAGWSEGPRPNPPPPPPPPPPPVPAPVPAPPAVPAPPD